MDISNQDAKELAQEICEHKNDYYVLATVQQRMFHFPEALAACKDGLEIFPGDPDLLQRLEEIRSLAARMEVILIED